MKKKISEMNFEITWIVALITVVGINPSWATTTTTKPVPFLDAARKAKIENRAQAHFSTGFTKAQLETKYNKLETKYNAMKHPSLEKQKKLQVINGLERDLQGP